MSLLSTPFVGTNADIILHSVAFFVLVGSITAALYGFWRIHELPISKAHRKEHNQIGLITVLTWIGFLWHWVWVIAVILAFVDIEKSIITLRDTWHSKPKSTPNQEV
ncbi:MFS transporter [Vibrio sp. FNV 38]|nr:MFS transporter [Vibrio sp. FNV 38]